MDSSGYSGPAGQTKPAPRGGFFCALILAACLLAAPYSGWLQAAPAVVVASYNIENYTLTGAERTRVKTTAARDAVADVAAGVHPDILGLCEVGSPEALEDLRVRLEKRGTRLPYVEYVDGPDPERHVALLSRFPFASRQSVPKVSFELNGVPELVRRGFLDVSVQINPQYVLRLIGVHLKSKLASPAGEALLRRMEALALRSLVERVIRENPNVNLLVYGDFNETKEEPSVRGVLGTRGGLNSLTDLPAEDTAGDRWTHYRYFTDVYSRIDYLMVNRALRPELATGRAYISDSPQWRKASDHRLIFTQIIPNER